MRLERLAVHCMVAPGDQVIPAACVWDGYQSYQMGSYESDCENREDEHVLS